jgi:AcrR family transcriptional regulator
MQNPGKMQARRQEILLAMAAVLAEKDYDALTLEDVANQMNCSKAVIYYQFRSKEELYVELVAQVLKMAADRLAEIVGSAEPPEVQLRAAVTDLVRIGFLPLNYAVLRTGRPSSIQPESRTYLRTLDRRYESMFTGIVERGIASGAVSGRNARLVAFTLIHGAHSVFKWYHAGGKLTPELLAEDVPAMLLGGALKH